MHILERSVAAPVARTAFAGLFVLATVGVTLVSFFAAGTMISAAASSRTRASAGSGHRSHPSARRASARVRVRGTISPGDRATIVDVAPGVGDGDAVKLVRLAPGEHVVTVDDCPAYRLGACALLRPTGPRPSFRDLEIAGGRGGPRRVVLLLH